MSRYFTRLAARVAAPARRPQAVAPVTPLEEIVETVAPPPVASAAAASASTATPTQSPASATSVDSSAQGVASTSATPTPFDILSSRASRVDPRIANAGPLRAVFDSMATNATAEAQSASTLPATSMARPAQSANSQAALAPATHAVSATRAAAPHATVPASQQQFRFETRVSEALEPTPSRTSARPVASSEAETTSAVSPPAAQPSTAARLAPAQPQPAVTLPARTMAAATTPSIHIGSIALEIRTPAAAPATPAPAAPQAPRPAAATTAASPVRFSAHRHYLR